MALRNLPIKTGQLFIGGAVIMGLVTVGLFASENKGDKLKKSVKIETQAVVVPTHPIMQGETLEMDDIKTVQWPTAYLPKGSTFEKTHDVLGRLAKQNLFPGEPLFKEKISGDGNGGLPAMIPQGMRAVTVAVTEVKGVAGFVKPGNRVDVLTTFEVESPDADGQGTTKTQLTRTVLQNVMILASAQSMVSEDEFDMETPEGVARGSVTPVPEEKGAKKEAAEKKKEKNEKELAKERKEREKAKREAEKRAKLVSSVTLALTPEQAERLALAEETGDIRLALRSDTDHKMAEVAGISFSELLEGGTGFSMMATPPAPPAMTQPAPPPVRYSNSRSVELIEGTEKTSLEF